jgi:hypothetical protein
MKDWTVGHELALGGVGVGAGEVGVGSGVGVGVGDEVLSVGMPPHPISMIRIRKRPRESGIKRHTRTVNLLPREKVRV